MADPDSSLTPEKRLLKLIEESDGTKKQEPGKENPSPAGAPPVSSVAEGKHSFKEHFSNFNEKGVRDFIKAAQGSFGLREINKLLRLAVIGLIFLLVFEVFWEMFRLKRELTSNIEIPESKITDFMPERGHNFDNALFDDGKFGSMFIPFTKRTEDAAKQKTEGSQRLLDMTKNLKLAGISYDPADAKRAFCMIEDIEKKITTFLREGDTLGAMNVAKINENTVVLQYQDETIEIR